MIARVELRDQRDKKSPLAESGAGRSARTSTCRAAQTALDPAAFFGQDQNALDRMTTDFARTIVSAILEAF